MPLSLSPISLPYLTRIAFYYCVSFKSSLLSDMERCSCPITLDQHALTLSIVGVTSERSQTTFKPGPSQQTGGGEVYGIYSVYEYAQVSGSGQGELIGWSGLQQHCIGSHPWFPFLSYILKIRPETSQLAAAFDRHWQASKSLASLLVLKNYLYSAQ